MPARCSGVTGRCVSSKVSGYYVGRLCPNLVESRRSAFGRADNVSGRLFIKLATAATRPNFGHAPLL